jgi:hypothetical protein
VDANGDPVITFPDDPLVGHAPVPDTTAPDPGYTLNDFYPASHPADVLPETPAPLSPGPSSITQGPEAQLIEQIINDALENGGCGEIMTCGPEPTELIDLANKQIAESQRIETARERVMRHNNPTGMSTEPVSTLDLIPLGGAVARLGRGMLGLGSALTAADLGLSGSGIAKLSGTVTNAGTTRIVHIGYVETARKGTLLGELRRAVPNMLGNARAAGVQTLQITGTAANPFFAQFAASQAARHGGTYASTGGMETLTFVLK